MRDAINLSGDFRSARVSIVTGDGLVGGVPDGGTDQAEADELLAALPLSDVPRPSPLPGGSVLPWRANRNFVGREPDLLLLAKALSDSTGDGFGRVVAASGIGGVGKTQVAVEFAHRYGRYFAGGVYWIDCGEPDSIAPQVANCAIAMRLSPPFGVGVDDRAVLVRTAWQQPTPRLIILDGCEHDEVLARWCPVTGGCRVLVTCRRPAWDASLGVRSVPIKPLPRPSSTTLLLRGRPDLSTDEPEVLAIAESLGDLPLALHLAASFLSRFKHNHLGEPGRYLASISASPILDHLSLTQADVRQAVEHAVRETRTGLPDATAPWTLHLGPGCTVENTESGNVFTVEPAAIALDADVKLRVLDQALEMIDPRTKAEPVSRLTPGFVRRREVREAVENLQRVLGIPMSGLVGQDTLTAVKFLAELAEH